MAAIMLILLSPGKPRLSFDQLLVYLVGHGDIPNAVRRFFCPGSFTVKSYVIRGCLSFQAMDRKHGEIRARLSLCLVH